MRQTFFILWRWHRQWGSVRYFLPGISLKSVFLSSFWSIVNVLVLMWKVLWYKNEFCVVIFLIDWENLVNMKSIPSARRSSLAVLPSSGQSQVTEAASITSFHYRAKPGRACQGQLRPHCLLRGLIVPSQGFLRACGQGLLAQQLPLGQAELAGAWGVSRWKTWLA